MDATIEITQRLDKGYNIWRRADSVFLKNQLTNYSSDWVIIGTASNRNRAVFFANKYLEGVHE